MPRTPKGRTQSSLGVTGRCPHVARWICRNAACLPSQRNLDRRCHSMGIQCAHLNAPRWGQFAPTMARECESPSRFDSDPEIWVGTGGA